MKLAERRIGRRIVYRGKILTAEVWTVRLPDGRTATREIARPPDAAAVVALDGGHVYLIRQYRPAVGRIVYEIPAGLISPGEAPAATARRECAEEIGLRPRRLSRLLAYYPSVGFSTGRIHLFLAQGLTRDRRAHLDDTEALSVHRVPLRRALAMIRDNRIIDSKAIIGLLLTADRLGADQRACRRTARPRIRRDAGRRGAAGRAPGPTRPAAPRPAR
jgi:ADP-ribose pyrophosphatase